MKSDERTDVRILEMKKTLVALLATVLAISVATPAFAKTHKHKKHHAKHHAAKMHNATPQQPAAVPAK